MSTTASRLIPRRLLALALLLGVAATWCPASADEPTPALHPVRLIFDTDVGNDIDDALALGVIHALESRGLCQLLAVTISKDNRWCTPFVDAVNSFYGRPQIPVGAVQRGFTPEDGNFLRQVVELTDDGQPCFPTSQRHAAEPAVDVLRRVLAAQPDQSVVIVVVGFSTNLAQLLQSPADQASADDGMTLVRRKCRLLSLMAGNFAATNRQPEYNVFTDVVSARYVFEHWPSPMVFSGFEIGEAVLFPASAVQQEFGYVPRHPLREAYIRYLEMPYDRPTWDLTSVLYAICPDREYFGLSETGRVTVDDRNVTQFQTDPNGRHRYLIVSPAQTSRLREALVQLASQPPS